MTLVSYISYPIIDVNGNVNYMKLDLQTNKLYMNNEMIINVKDVVNELNYADDCCDEGCEECGDECGDDCECYHGESNIPTKDEMFQMLKEELAKAKELNDSEMEKDIIGALKMLSMMGDE